MRIGMAVPAAAPQGDIPTSRPSIANRLRTANARHIAPMPGRLVTLLAEKRGPRLE